ncbi:P-loop containing nucleoside triphosphate hydrolase protein [Podospora aff. communis PSN243]|uniref:P-loop containing nucleoside triphosphate hydrolase protein n=1 Tax=Podospora aff. communis PSN243 TaxID=3040156 RepID=A0AAV9H299_9PEZI|nr:P-loop containing nucleoside triphosphate hydrolase protein [Podospora aff. communis PSN243]
MNCALGAAGVGQPWQCKPENPEPSEIAAEQVDPRGLPENPVDQPWTSEDDYFATQYQLLRCEATEGLRYSVGSYRKCMERPYDVEHTWIYPEVRVKAYLLARLGPIVRIEFSTQRSPFKINWLQSRRLTPGKLVALTTKKDAFRTICKIATVAQRPYRDGLDKDPPEVDLVWANLDDTVLDPTTELVMVESTHGFFEASRHSLAGLQEVSRAGSPLVKYLTGAYNSETRPAFLLENPVVDLSSLVHVQGDPTTESSLESHDIVKHGMPNIDSVTTLDASQREALLRILTQELAVVQGPPGTGKTFTSVEAIKAIVATRRKHNGSPIIISAQTNHALDHILLHCLNAGIKLVRVGGGTSEQAIRDRTLYETRQRCGFAQGDDYRAKENSRRENMDAIERLVKTLFGDQLLDPKALRDLGIITEDQHKSLAENILEPTPGFEKLGPFGRWLGECRIEAKVLRTRHTAPFEQYEALPEDVYEAEGDLQNIADDEDDYDRINGKLVPLKYTWTGKDPSRQGSVKRAWDQVAERELSLTRDLWSIRRELRGIVYRHLQARYLANVRPVFIDFLKRNSQLCKDIKAIKAQQDAKMLVINKIDIVGCTTTGLTKYRQFLSALKPRSLLIEEAAETREANIVSALYPSIEQLILVGDHQQLAPNSDIHWLGAPPYNLNVSLFQRMVNLRMPFTMLKQQRRMKPELRSILSPFYPELTDHELVLSTKNRPNVPGMGNRNCWFFDHKWPEETNSDRSKYNDEEAEMIVGFFAYLVANGMPADKITILTFYTGQRKVIMSKLKKQGSLLGLSFKVFTVDSYQGEENDVVLLSLVRSPHPERVAAVGFLEDRRRAVVAISRARCGLYVFGNIENTFRAGAESCSLWGTIWKGFADQDRVQQQLGLPLVCTKHGRVKYIREVRDWGDNAGGCDEQCSETRPCGHPCTLKCHPTAHELLGCSQLCKRRLICGHPCEGFCSQDCFCRCDVFKNIASGNKTRDESSQWQNDEGPLEGRLLEFAESPSILLQNAAVSRSSKGLDGTRASSQPSGASAARQDYRKRVNEREKEAETVLARARDQTLDNESTSVRIKDTYRPTELVDGYRVSQGPKIVERLGISEVQTSAFTPSLEQKVESPAQAKATLQVDAQTERKASATVETAPSTPDAEFMAKFSKMMEGSSGFAGNQYKGKPRQSQATTNRFLGKTRAPSSDMQNPTLSTPSAPTPDGRTWVEYGNQPPQRSSRKPKISSVSSDATLTTPHVSRPGDGSSSERQTKP